MQLMAFVKIILVTYQTKLLRQDWLIELILSAVMWAISQNKLSR